MTKNPQDKMGRETYAENRVASAYFLSGMVIIFALSVALNSSPVYAAKPTFDNISDGDTFTIAEDSLFTYWINATDADLEYPLNFQFTANNLSAFSLVDYDAQRGLMNFTPENDDVGVHGFYLVVGDAGTPSESQSVSVIFNVTNTNDPPNITGYYPVSLEQTATENVSTLLFNYTADDPDLDYGDNLTSNWMVDGAVASVNSSNFTYSPSFCDFGLHNISLNVSDVNGSYRTVNWTLNVTNTNRPPQFNASLQLPNITWQEDNSLIDNITLSVFFSDNDALECNSSNADTITYSVSGNSSIAVVINQTTGNVSFYPTGNWSGNETVVFTASDSYASSDSNYIVLNVTNVNDPPYLAFEQNKTWAIGIAYTEQLSASDPDEAYGDILNFSYSVNGSFPAFSMNLSGYINFTPTALDQGDHAVNITVNDSSGQISYAIRNFYIIQNDPPFIVPIANQAGTENVLFNLTAYASDPNSDSLTFSSNYSSFSTVSYNSTAGGFYFTPSNSDVGNHTINITVADAYGFTNNTVFNLEILDVNNDPAMGTVTNQVAKINRNFVYYVNATDADNDVLNFTSNSSLFNVTLLTLTGSGMINFTPDISQSGNYTFNLTVYDGLNASSTVLLNITVTENRPPVLAAIANQTAYTGTMFSANISAYDLDFDHVNISVNYSRLMFSVVNSSTKTFFFNPVVGDVGNHTILVLANDSDQGYGNFTFNLEVIRLNHAPYFANASNFTCTLNSSCGFNITAYDIDGDTLSLVENMSIFSIATVNTTINTTTFRLNFTPSNISRLNYIVNLTVNDSEKLNYTLIYIVINQPPVINSYAPTSLAASINENGTVLFNHTSSDPEGYNLTYSWQLALENASLVAACGSSSGTNQTACEANARCEWHSSASGCLPINRYGSYTEKSTSGNYTYSAGYDSAGNYSLVLFVFDDLLANSSIAWNISVANANRAPVYGKMMHDSYAELYTGNFNFTNLTGEGYLRLEINGSSYISKGEYISPTIDFSDAATELAYTSLSYTGSMPNNTLLAFYTQTSDDGDFNGSAWSSAITENNSQITSDVYRYLRYKIAFNTSNLNITPNVSSVSIGYTAPNKTWSKNTVLLNWIDLDDYYYDLDSDDSINISVTGNDDINVEIDAATHRVNLRPSNDFVGTEVITFVFNDGYANVSSNRIEITTISNSSDSATVQPVAVGGGGGGSGGFVAIEEQTEQRQEEKEKELVNYEIIVPGIPVYYSNGTIITPVAIINTANETFSGIYLTASSDNSKATPILSETYIEALEVGQQKEVSLTLTSEDVYGTFEVVIEGRVQLPAFTDSAKIILSSIEKGEVNKSQVNTKIAFVRDLLNENPECLELNELLESAKTEIASGNLNRATLIIDSVIESCKYLITNKEATVEKRSPLRDAWKQVKSLIQSPVVYLTVLTIIFSASMILFYYLYRRPKVET